MPEPLASYSCGSFKTLRRFGARLSVVGLLCLICIAAIPVSSHSQTSCCVQRGNINGSVDGIIDILDLTYLVSYMFKAGPPPPCLDAADVNSQPAQIDILDLTYLVSWMFKSGPLPVPCNDGGLSPMQREVVFNAIDSVEDANLSRPPDSLAAVYVSYLLTRPEIEAAEVIDSISAWARFVDGRLLIIPNDREPTVAIPSNDGATDNTEDTIDPQPFVQPPRRFPNMRWDTPADIEAAAALVKSPATTQFELPTSVQARVITTLGTNCFVVARNKLINLLQGNGYVMASSNGTVPGLLNVSGDGVFVIEAHCGSGKTKGGAVVPAIWTSTEFTYALDTAYTAMLNANELTYMKAKDQLSTSGQCASHWRFAFTGLFVAQYMNFAQHSFVMIAACKSDQLPLQTGFKTAGASVYAGWTLTVTDDPANKAAEFLIDRMLGANGSTLTPKESPPQRPFTVMPLWQDMKNRNFDFDVTTGSLLKVTRLKDGFDLLAPTIRFLQVLETGDSLQVNGIFGTDPGPHGRVIVGGTELPIISWDPLVITCNIPNTGLGSVGPVTVEVDGLGGPGSSVKRKSNEVNLTEWRGPVTYTRFNSGDLTGIIQFNIHLRADLHKFRNTPHTPPAANQFIISGGAEDSYGTASASGQFVYLVSTNPVETYTYTWNGSSPIPGLWESAGWGGFILGSQVFANTRIMKLTLAGGIYFGSLTETLVSSIDGELNSGPLELYTPYEVFDFGGTLDITLNNSWDIVSGKRVAITCCAKDPDNQDINHEISWPTILSSFPPDTMAAQ